MAITVLHRLNQGLGSNEELIRIQCSTATETFFSRFKFARFAIATNQTTEKGIKAVPAKTSGSVAITCTAGDTMTLHVWGTP